MHALFGRAPTMTAVIERRRGGNDGGGEGDGQRRQRWDKGDHYGSVGDDGRGEGSSGDDGIERGEAGGEAVARVRGEDHM